jgi:hypothetical protein
MKPVSVPSPSGENQPSIGASLGHGFLWFSEGAYPCCGVSPGSHPGTSAAVDADPRTVAPTRPLETAASRDEKGRASSSRA